MDLIVRDSIARPAAEVYRTITMPDGLSRFFTTTASGPMVEGTKVTWFWANHQAEMVVTIGPMVGDQLISWEWEAIGTPTQVRIELTDKGPEQTLLTITESSFELTPEGMASVAGQAQGWGYFGCTLRDWLLHGIETSGSGPPEVSATVRSC